MFRNTLTRTLLLRGVLAATAVAVVIPTVAYSTDADAKRSRSKRAKAKAKAKAAKAKKEKARAEAAAAKLKVEMDMHYKHMGAIERISQIADSSNDAELKAVVVRLKEKEAKRHAMVK